MYLLYVDYKIPPHYPSQTSLKGMLQYVPIHCTWYYTLVPVRTRYDTIRL